MSRRRKTARERRDEELLQLTGALTLLLMNHEEFAEDMKRLQGYYTLVYRILAGKESAGGDDERAGR